MILRPSVEEAVTEIAALTSFSIGTFWLGKYNDDEKLLTKLSQIATIDELLLLTNHKSTSVKAMAAMALADKNYVDLAAIFTKLLSKNERIWTGRGAHGEEDQLAGVLYRYIQLQIEEKKASFYTFQLESLDRTLLYAEFLLKTDDYEVESLDENPMVVHETRISLLEHLLFYLEPQEKYYNQIRRLCQKHNYQGAYKALAKFQKEQDITLIFEKAPIGAMAYFPHPAFWNYIKNRPEKDRGYGWSFAVAAYQNQEAANILLDVIDKMTSSNISDAITQHYCSLYDSIAIRLWEDYQTIDFEIAPQLIKKDAKKAAQVFAKGFNSIRGYHFQNKKWYKFDFHQDIIDTSFTLMLETIDTHSPNDLAIVCPIFLSKKNYIFRRKLLLTIKKYRVSSTTDILLKRLRFFENTNYVNSGDYLIIVDVLLAFKDENINDIVYQSLKKDGDKRFIGGTDWKTNANDILKSHDLTPIDFKD